MVPLALHPRRLVPLQIAVAFVFALIVLAISGGLVWYNHQQLTALAEREAAEDFHTIADAVRGEVGDILRIGETVLDTAALTIDPSLPPDRMTTLLVAMMGQIERVLPSAMGLFVGADDGTLIEVQRPSRVPAAKLAGLDTNAAWAVMLVERTPAGATETWLTLDAAGHATGRSAPHPTDFDPRTRPWYLASLAVPRAIVTKPYRFANIPEAGLTVARAMRPRADIVLGLDVTLADLDAFLARHRTPPVLEPVIFDRTGGLVAHPQGDLMRHAGTGAALTGEALPQLGTLSSPIVAAMGRAFAESGLNRQVGFSVGTQAYFARFEAAGPALGDYVIGVAVPQDAILGAAGRIRQNLLVVSVAAVLLALVFVSVAARSLARPLKRATADLGRITRLDFGAVQPVASRITEVDDLGRALTTLELALQNFARYVPISLVRGIVDRSFSPHLGGYRQPITILFSDIQGFTGIAETLDPELLTSQISRYFTEIGHELQRSGATIDKYIGDSIMAFWNAPEAQPDHIDRACLGALRAARQVARFNAAAIADGARPMPTRFGLHTGEAVVGNVGSIDRMNYTALGHNVNLASRLEGLNKAYGTTIIASEAVVSRASSHFTFRFLDNAVPHGASEPIALYELLGATIAEEPELAATFADMPDRQHRAEYSTVQPPHP